MFLDYAFNWLLHWTRKFNLFFTIKFVCCFSSDKWLNMLLVTWTFFFLSILLSALLNLLLCTQILCENNHFRSYRFYKFDFFCLVEICSLSTCWKLFVFVLLYYFCEIISSLLIWTSFISIIGLIYYILCFSCMFKRLKGSNTRVHFMLWELIIACVKGVKPSGSWPSATQLVASVRRLLRRGCPCRRLGWERENRRLDR